jgi:hypothetical protein
MRIAMIVFNTAGEGTYWRAYHLAVVAGRSGAHGHPLRNRWRLDESQSEE